MSLFYNRRGEAITLEQWAALDGDWEKNFRVAITDVVTPNGAKATVSTVLLGIDHGRDPNKAPLIFETMVFASADASEDGTTQTPDFTAPFDHETRRYSSEADALAGHAAIVKWMSEFGSEPVADESRTSAPAKQETAAVAESPEG
ncbi:hypothetical protein [Leifsonia sp. Leaf264]|uniref:hypothetical protein n=1 Tax=Leifsonia sp. Leaf264 TaxID=1736314 RepID=UPI0006F5D0F3|nr:hypothetical protein [Leifsonia sp. Leaf264]KQO98568.1 hypothetical protein ASF30_10935 [Leifsonia sp. Leaf264]